MMIFLNTNLLRKELKIKAGVYGIINTKTSKQYIGSSRSSSLEHQERWHRERASGLSMTYISAAA